MSKQISFRDEEIEELKWIVQEYIISNVDPYLNNIDHHDSQNEKRICTQILNKLGVK